MAIGGATWFASHNSDDLASQIATAESKTYPQAKNLKYDTSKDQQKDLSSVSPTSDAKLNLVGSYLLQQSDNSVCGKAGSQMQIRWLKAENPVLSVANGALLFNDINRGQTVEAPMEGDKLVQSFERTTQMNEDSLSVDEVMKSLGEPATHATTSLELHAGVLTYTFHQEALNPKFGSLDIHCEWIRH